MKNNTVFCFLGLLFLNSCQLASYTARPGVIVKDFPNDMAGTYIQIEKNNGVSDTHTLVIKAQGAEINDPIIGKILDMSDTNNSLSHLGDFYYLNVSSTDSLGKPVYYIYPFEYDQKNLYVYKLILSKKSQKRMKRSGLKMTGRKNGEYIMDNEAFKRYCEKFMKRKEAIKFRRIK